MLSRSSSAFRYYWNAYPWHQPSRTAIERGKNCKLQLPVAAQSVSFLNMTLRGFRILSSAKAHLEHSLFHRLISLKVQVRGTKRSESPVPHYLARLDLIMSPRTEFHTRTTRPVDSSSSWGLVCKAYNVKQCILIKTIPVQIRSMDSLNQPSSSTAQLHPVASHHDDDDEVSILPNSWPWGYWRRFFTRRYFKCMRFQAEAQSKANVARPRTDPGAKCSFTKNDMLIPVCTTPFVVVEQQQSRKKRQPALCNTVLFFEPH
jgi:hypothetical protein